MKYPMIFLSVLTAGILAAQTPAPSAPQHQAHAGQRSRMERLTAGLNLTADQQRQTHEIFGQSRTQMKALMPRLREERAAMAGAVKTDSENQIDQLAQQHAQLRAQMEAMHAKTLAKFYTILTPDQKAKFDQRMNRMMGSVPRHHARRSSANA
jgi:Spy/CpxP family protein refolding chaperone